PAFPAETTAAAPTKGLDVSSKHDRVVWSTCKTQPDLALVHFDGGVAQPPHPIFPPTEWRDEDPAAIPHGSFVVVSSDRAGKSGLWLLDRSGSAAKRIDTAGLVAERPAPSPDGKWIAFASPGVGIHVV